MLTLPSVWQFNNDLRHYTGYLSLLDQQGSFDDNNRNDTMNYAYLKFLVGRYNDFMKQIGNSENLMLPLKHTGIKDPFYTLKILQKTEWTKFLQIMFDWFINQYEGVNNFQPTKRLYLNELNDKLSNDILEAFAQGLKKICHLYTVYFNRFKQFIIDFILSLPSSNLSIFIKNLNFYLGSSSINLSILLNNLEEI